MSKYHDHENSAKMTELKDWQLFFQFKYGERNRMDIMRSFVRFFDSDSEKNFSVTGKCMLGGKLYGDKHYPEGESVFTSDIVSIKRVGRTDKYFGLKQDVFRATTASGGEYYFRADEYSPCMYLMMGDIRYLGLLSKRSSRYLPPELRARGLL